MESEFRAVSSRTPLELSAVTFFRSMSAPVDFTRMLAPLMKSMYSATAGPFSISANSVS